jgi:membrane protease YdiL (CAAX protease family)
LRRLHPLLVLVLWLVAAFVIIGLGPMFFPAMASTVRLEAVAWKIFGAGLLLSASLYLLRRSLWGTSVLGLRPSGRNLGWLLAGSLGGVLLVAAWLAILRAFTPFHFEIGSISPAELAVAVLVYLFGALLEELAFRGHPLLGLKERYGAGRAVLAVSLAFGILHLPGTSGIGAVKMIVTTGLCSVIFSIAYLRSGSLWSAVGLHMAMNVTLHSVSGAGGGAGPSLLRAVFDSRSPPAFDAGFWAFTAAAVMTIAALGLLRPPHRFAQSSAVAVPS